MANSPQAKKRARQAEKHRALNASQRSNLRTYIKAVIAAINNGDLEASKRHTKKLFQLLIQL